MIWNGYAIVDGFLTLLRLGVGLLVLVLALRARFTARQAAADQLNQEAAEERLYLAFLAAALLMTLSVLSWSTFYLLLQSYVREWPGVMCIYGVTQIGRGTIGLSRHLPPLVLALEIAKPTLVFLSGVWLVLHRANHRSRTAPLTGRIVLILCLVAILGVLDATAELAYLAIPKKEIFPSAGCCTGFLDTGDGPSRFLPSAILGGHERELVSAYYGINVGIVLLLRGLRRDGFRRPGQWLTASLAAMITTAVNGVFLVDVVAPRLLEMPNHHCAYDLVAVAPISLVPVGLFVLGGFAVGWASFSAWAERATGVDQSRSTATALLRLATGCYLVSLVWTTLELALHAIKAT